MERILGGACTYVSLAASHFTPVHVVAVVGEDFDEQDMRLLTSHGVDLAGLERAPGKTFYWKGRYSEDMNNRSTIQTDLNVFASFEPKLPDSYRAYPYLLLANIQPALQRNVRAQMNRLRVTVGDTMDLWINNDRDELVRTIRDWDVLLINDSEARLLTGETNLLRAARAIRAMGPRTLVIKRGEYGAVLFRDDYVFSVPGYLLEQVVDPTGAGDCFAGGFLGYLANRELDFSSGDPDPCELGRAVVYGSVMGSFCCEKLGVERFRTLTRAEIDDRFQQFQAFTRF